MANRPSPLSRLETWCVADCSTLLGRTANHYHVALILPVDALLHCLAYLGFRWGLLLEDEPGGSETDWKAGAVYVAPMVPPPADERPDWLEPDPLLLARQLGHIRLHAAGTDRYSRMQREEADVYGAVFLAHQSDAALVPANCRRAIHAAAPTRLPLSLREAVRP